MDGLDTLIPALAEPLGLAGLGALGIWAAYRVLVVGLGAWERAELARIAVQQAMATAIEAHAEAAAGQSAATATLSAALEGIRSEQREHGITLRVVAAQTGALPIRRADTATAKGDA